jgi:hypothetical protein
MNWHVHYRLLRPTVLSESEKDTLLEHNRRVRDEAVHSYDFDVALQPRSDDLVAFGRVELYYSDPDEADVRRLLDALTELHGLLPETTLEVWDDFDLVGWNGAVGGFDTMGACDVPSFELPRTSEGFLKLSSLSHDHRFVLHRQAATPLVVPAEGEQGTLVHLAKGPTFVVRPGRRREEARMAIWLNPSEHPSQLSALTLTFFDDQGQLLDHESHGLDVLLCRPTRITVTLSAPELLDLATQVEVEIRSEAVIALDLGRWAVKRQGRGLSLTPAEPLPASSWPLTLSLGGFEDDDCGARRWRMVGQLTLDRVPLRWSAELRLTLLDDQAQAIGSHVEYLDPDNAGRFGGWWFEELDEQAQAQALGVRLDLTATECCILGRWEVPSR